MNADSRNGNCIGRAFRVVTFGESHGPAVGVVIDGVRPGMELSREMVMAELLRRRPGSSELVSPRAELDEPEILSGIFEGRTTGAPICIVVRNRDSNPSEYESVAALFRPGHGDHSWFSKYGIRDWRGGGRQSGRETVGRVAAGAVAKAFLKGCGITVRAHVVRIGRIEAPFTDRTRIDWAAVESSPVRCADRKVGLAMEAAVLKAKESGDSVGGIVEVIVDGVPAGLGEPVFGRLDAELAGALMSIGSVKGVEIGAGFSSADMPGSRMVDEMDSSGYLTNNAGGIAAGVSTGMPILCRIAVKPTPTVNRSLRTLGIDGNPVEFRRDGRRDPCICPRIVPVAESMAAIVIADAWLSQSALTEGLPHSDRSGQPERSGILKNSEVARIRARLDEVDAGFIDAFAGFVERRLELASYLGAIKRGEGMPVIDSAREAAVRRRWHELLDMAGLPPEIVGENMHGLIDELLDLVVAGSRKVQF